MPGQTQGREQIAGRLAEQFLKDLRSGKIDSSHHECGLWNLEKFISQNYCELDIAHHMAILGWADVVGRAYGKDIVKAAQAKAKAGEIEFEIVTADNCQELINCAAATEDRICITGAASKTKRGTLTGLAYSGDLMRIEGWGLVLISLKGMARKSKTPLIDSHSTESLEDVVGYCETDVKNNQLVISGRISESTPAGKTLMALNDDGIELELSVGVQPIKTKYIRAGETIKANGRSFTSESDFTFVETSSLREISVVALGADSNTSLSIAAAAKKQSNNFFKGSSMAKQKTAVMIDDEFDAEGVQEVLTANGQPALMARACKESWTVERAELESLRLLQASGKLGILRDATPQLTGITGMRQDGGIDDRMLAKVASLIHMGGSVEAERMVNAKKIHESVYERARQIANNGSQAFIKALASIRGQNDIASLDGSDLMRAAYSTNLLPSALTDCANLVVADVYIELKPAWLSFCNQMDLANFLPNPILSPNFGGAYSEVGKGGEVKYAVVDKNFDATMQLATYAERITITRQDFISQPGIYAPIVRAFASKCLATQGRLIYACMLANGSSFFSTTNGNYVDGATTVLQDASLADAIKTLRLTKDKGGNLLGYEPSVLIVPASLEQTARILLNSSFTQRTMDEDKQSTGGWIPKNLILVVAGELETASVHANYSSTGWYLAANKLFTSVAIGTLQGQLQPIIESWTPGEQSEVLGYSFRGYTDFACKLVNPAAIVKYKGSV
jgi:hypothetical protein